MRDYFIRNKGKKSFGQGNESNNKRDESMSFLLGTSILKGGSVNLFIYLNAEVYKMLFLLKTFQDIEQY